ncbi:MAG: monovalent cation/H(+) antiporter subunit G [Chloroflexota bacterium]|nr:monovalent cation/H(+) antiporter subunit G [Chloroflexota bacterium]MBI5703297.1 monovalent cation/H(+) antiporter subunit G [Chloroflexota bacterium]
MEIILQLVAFLLLVLGTLLSIIGVIGFIRLPDVYTRLHATGKVSVFGLVFLLLAADILTPLATWKALLLIFFVLAASPAVSHAISSAAYRVGIPLVGKRDDLKGKMERGKEKE